jgi:hypothetical protein
MPAEQLIAPNEAIESLRLNDGTMLHLGDLAITSSEHEVVGREITIGDGSYKTNLPEGIDPFIKEKPGLGIVGVELVPSKLDPIPRGEYTLSGLNLSDTASPVEAKRTIEIRTNEHGPVINREAFKNEGDWTMTSTDNARLFTLLGYEFDDPDPLRPSRIPLPETLVAAASKLGLSIELHDQAKIISEDYLGSFAKRQFPVGTADEHFYEHDTSDTHFLTMLLGGDEIMDALSGAAQRALQGDKATVNNATSNIDKYTAALSDIYSENYATSGDEAMDRGLDLGISKEETQKIITGIQSKAQEYGILPRPKVEQKVYQEVG